MAKSTPRKRHGETTTAANRAPKARIDARSGITEADIASRAYDLFLARGCEPGHQLEDWLQAEQELRESSLASV